MAHLRWDLGGDVDLTVQGIHLGYLSLGVTVEHRGVIGPNGTEWTPVEVGAPPASRFESEGYGTAPTGLAAEKPLADAHDLDLLERRLSIRCSCCGASFDGGHEWRGVLALLGLERGTESPFALG